MADGLQACLEVKQTTIKPTVVYSARQHANEVSSTSHILKLAELLATDPDPSRRRIARAGRCRRARRAGR